MGCCWVQGGRHEDTALGRCSQAGGGRRQALVPEAQPANLPPEGQGAVCSEEAALNAGHRGVPHAHVKIVGRRVHKGGDGHEGRRRRATAAGRRRLGQRAGHPAPWRQYSPTEGRFGGTGEALNLRLHARRQWCCEGSGGRRGRRAGARAVGGILAQMLPQRSHAPCLLTTRASSQGSGSLPEWRA